MKKFFDCGIDLGTTNSCIAKPNSDNTCIIVDNAEGSSVTPSVVSINRVGKVYVGARANRVSNPADVKKEFKRDMGTNTVYNFSSSGIKKTPVELSAEVLGELKRDFESRFIGKNVEDVIITVPAAFSLVQCEATKRAGIAAGFKNIILLQEPIAAAVAYGAEPDAKEQYWLVFDYGGGTLDVSIISTKDGHLDNINSRGNNHMGGKDLDRILYEEIILPKMKLEYKLSNGLDEISTSRIMEDVEACKKELSSKQVALFCPDNIGEVTDDEGRYIDFSCEISRDEFEKAIRSQILVAVDIARKALSESLIQDSSVDRILLVGGTSLIPIVREELQKEFSIKLDCSLNPMTVVAEGAALFAASQVLDVNEIEDTEQSEYQLVFEYNSITSLETENICGTINGAAGTIKKVKIDCIVDENSTNALWSSGWSDVLDDKSAAFDIDVKICNYNAPNLYRISAIDKDASAIQLCGYLFEIVHKESSLKVLAPPMPHAIGVLANDGKMNRISWFSEKNTKLPISKTCSFILDKTLDPTTDDICDFMFYEGEKENECNPNANQVVGKVEIKSSIFNQKINKGAEIEITLDIDISRAAKVSAYFPDLGIEVFKDKELHEIGGEVDVMSKMSELEQELQSTKYTLDTLKKKNIEIGNLYVQFNEIEENYDKYLDMINRDNDAVLLYIQNFHSLQTEIIRLEIKSESAVEQQESESLIHRAEDNIDKYGSQEEKIKFEDYKRQISNIHDDDSKRFLEGKIDELESKVLNNSFEWLNNLYSVIYESGYATFKDQQKAGYWKEQARNAIKLNNINELRKAIVELQNLRLSTASETVNKSLANLRIR